MSKYRVIVSRTETKFAEIDVEAVNEDHAEAVADREAGNIDFSDKSLAGDPVYELEVQRKLRDFPYKAELWKTMIHSRNHDGGWNWSGMKRVPDDKTLYEVHEKTDFVKLCAEKVGLENMGEAAHIAANMVPRYIIDAVEIIDPSDHHKPIYVFTLDSKSNETWKEWWRHIACHKCDQCESMPGDEQRWHSQTFEFVHTLDDSDDEELHGHAVYRCPVCKGFVVCELVEETMDENGVVD